MARLKAVMLSQGLSWSGSGVRSAAQRGLKLVVLVDDAYFGLVYEAGVMRESLFALLCGLHPNLLAVKLDGPTKEDYVWGFRVGFLTYGIGHATPASAPRA